VTTDSLQPVYEQALRCFNSMETTKRRHFEFLSQLEDKKKRIHLEATPAEVSRLAILLADHNREVGAFKLSCQELKADNPDAHAALFEYISFVNSDGSA